MDKLKMQSENLVNENIDKIAKLFPNCITEGTNENGEIVKLVDFDLLKQELSSQIVEGTDERYTLNWAGKKQAILTANSPINATLRPCRDESVDFDNTKNLYIEGDNLDVLKLLRETYLGKVKMIYIDPPYNTGHDFVYEDDFASSTEDYLQASKSYDDNGNRLFANNDSNGRFHSDWLSMMYSRIKISKDLLTDNGAIFVSIDDHEIDNLKKICNEIFGENNFIACVVWQRTYAPISLKKYFSESHEYCLIYSRNIDNFKMNLLPRTEKQNKDYKNPDNDPRGVWKIGNLTVGPAVEKQIYPITGPTGKIFMPPSGRCWRFTKEKFEQMREDNRIWFGSDGSNSPVPKLFLTEVQDGVTPMTLWTFDEAGHGQEATRELRDLMDGAVFTNPKPLRYIERFLRIGTDKNDLVLDFFSGSSTTAHTLMKLNAEDGGNRKFIMIQLPEICDEGSVAFKSGLKNICEIGKERIRRAGINIKDKNRMFAPNLDVGFRVLKLDSSCMKDVYYDPNKMSQDLLAGLEDNIKEDRTPEDLLFQVMLDMGVMLSSEIKILDIQGKKVFNVNDGNLVCCFDKNLTDEVVTEIAKMKPLYAVFRDSSMAKDSVAVNFDQIFETYSSETVRKVL